ncbi:MAG: hypothetical protein QOF89_2041 [Acidobacteriota bacterium]|jgi:hypothetical protein|nr:hypothetical protein [Acidobacteriota bacterium]
MAQAARESVMIGVKEAVRIAAEYLASLYEGKDLRDVLLEEVRLSDDDQYWLVTMGFSRPVPTNPVLEALGGENLKREYKVFEVSAETGDVRSMSIREA